MRPLRSSSFICPVSEAPHQKGVTPAVGAASRHALALREARARGGSQSAQQVLTGDLPAWAAATAAAGRRAGRRKNEIDTPDSEGRNVYANDTPLVDCGRPLGKCRTTTMSACRLAPLLTVADAAGILNVSMRTIQRLIASRAIPAVSIGRSVRLRPEDIEQLLARGGVCND
jgi:excisionase family DNA binding protein